MLTVVWSWNSCGRRRDVALRDSAGCDVYAKINPGRVLQLVNLDIEPVQRVYLLLALIMHNTRFTQLTLALDRPDEIQRSFVAFMSLPPNPIYGQRHCKRRTTPAGDQYHFVEVISPWYVSVRPFDGCSAHHPRFLDRLLVQLSGEAVLRGDDKLCWIVRNQRERMCL